MTDSIDNKSVTMIDNYAGQINNQLQKQRWLTTLEKAYLDESQVGKYVPVNVDVRSNQHEGDVGGKLSESEYSVSKEIPDAYEAINKKDTGAHALAQSSVPANNKLQTVVDLNNRFAGQVTSSTGVSHLPDVSKINNKLINKLDFDLETRTMFESQKIRIVPQESGLSIVMQSTTNEIANALHTAKQLRAQLTLMGYRVVNVIVNGEVMWSQSQHDEALVNAASTAHLINKIF